MPVSERAADIGITIDMKSAANPGRSEDAAADAAAAIDIREAAAGDLAEIVALDGRITGFTRTGFWTDLFGRRRTSESLCILVATHAGRIVGYALGEVRAWPVRAPACGWLYAIGVDERHRLRKAASALLTELIARFRNRGVGVVRTMIDVDDHLLMSFLRSFGMTAGPFVELELTTAAGSGEQP